jgi:hypothetical protein
MHLIHIFSLEYFPTVKEWLIQINSPHSVEDKKCSREFALRHKSISHVIFISPTNIIDIVDLSEKCMIELIPTFEYVDLRMHDTFGQTFISPLYYVPHALTLVEKYPLVYMNLVQIILQLVHRECYLLIMKHFGSPRWLSQYIIVLIFICLPCNLMKILCKRIT